jgi:hypothetical protein
LNEAGASVVSDPRVAELVEVELVEYVTNADVAVPHRAIRSREASHEAGGGGALGTTGIGRL